MRVTRLKILLLSSVAFLILFFFSCNKKESSLETALQLAGSNRDELEKVLKHYSERTEDSLKLKSAVFLIGNMPYHYTIEDSVFYEYYHKADSVFKLNLRFSGTRDGLDSLYKDFASSLNNAFRKGFKKNDIEHITSEYLIHNIDYAYDIWQEGVWGKHVNFEDFLEYILPYRFGTEAIEDWRNRLEEKFSKKNEWLNDYDQKRHSAYWATLHLNHEFHKEA